MVDRHTDASQFICTSTGSLVLVNVVGKVLIGHKPFTRLPAILRRRFAAVGPGLTEGLLKIRAKAGAGSKALELETSAQGYGTAEGAANLLPFLFAAADGFAVGNLVVVGVEVLPVGRQIDHGHHVRFLNPLARARIVAIETIPVHITQSHAGERMDWIAIRARPFAAPHQTRLEVIPIRSFRQAGVVIGDDNWPWVASDSDHNLRPAVFINVASIHRHPVPTTIGERATQPGDSVLGVERHQLQVPPAVLKGHDDLIPRVAIYVGRGCGDVEDV